MTGQGALRMNRFILVPGKGYVYSFGSSMASISTLRKNGFISVPRPGYIFSLGS